MRHQPALAKYLILTALLSGCARSTIITEIPADLVIVQARINNSEIIGYDLFQRHVVEIDYADRVDADPGRHVATGDDPDKAPHLRPLLSTPHPHRVMKTPSISVMLIDSRG